MANPPIVRVRNKFLSLWQSVVSEFIRTQPGFSSEGYSSVVGAVRAHPMMQATDRLAALLGRYPSAEVRREVQSALSQASLEGDNYLVLSELCFRMAQARVAENQPLLDELSVEYRKYSDNDPGFLTCVTTYAEYYVIYGGVMKYNDWQIQGGGKINYGVIGYQLPNNAKVAILGDWGTGMDDATQLLANIVQMHQPDAIIHLGDIYYSGTPDECATNFSKVFDKVLGTGNRIPVFSIPGNHDYYAFAYGYYDMVQALNAGLSSQNAIQPASYFSLQTQDGQWQFLGMDTGFYDSNPAAQVDPWATAPALHPSEVTWLQDKLNKFDGATIMLSHHQLFSANNKLNGSMTDYSNFPFVNPFLLGYFQQYFQNKIAGWFWGHEHNFVAYANNLAGLSKGRLVGCSAFEELTSANPYTINNPQVPYLDPKLYQLGAANGYYNHGYAIVDLGTRTSPTDPVTVNYYQYPSWGDTRPKPPISESLVLTEQLQKPTSNLTTYAQYNTNVKISLGNFFTYFSKINSGVFNTYYATVSPDSAQQVSMQILGPNGATGTIYDGALVSIKTLDTSAGKYNMLGAYSNHWLYYYSPDSSKSQQWIIRKVYPNGTSAICYNEPVYFTSVAYSGQYLTLSSDGYLTTSSSVPTAWSLQQ